MKSLAAYLMRGRMQAIVVVSTLAITSLLLPPLSIVSSAGVALVALRKGFSEGLMVFLGGIVATAILSQLVIGNFQVGFGYSLFVWFPALLIAALLRLSGQISIVFETSILVGAFGIFIFYLYNADPTDLWETGLKNSFQPLLERAAGEIDINQLNEGISFISQYMTGILAAATVLSMVSALLLARWWQALLFNPGGFRKEFLGLRVHSWISYFCLILISVAVASSGALSEFAFNMCILMFVLYLAVGVAVLHYLISVTTAKRFLLITMYLVLFFIPHALLPVMLLGLTDTWLDWRSKVSSN